ncbi:iron dicitrate transporter FecR [Pseudomonas putida]|uniref:Iron dicitrate transporter FecR n=1 Tax=Pseudomonas putida TaxID=303 RepID=A0AA37RFK6_PSEPU|nr:FecR domain-containing protein [Pseudomonas putida]GLO15402.1 iron dicitrate transporter FecR [Pseudomonas putida]GLO33224.1 iron dicitrate transporter FecR [Pseudomonas putida]HDS0966771.1 FecR domain-containing protein [Pseudomonas putida]HDS0990391.1 FecR domain-containing protein [Pseudomonas putida]
MTVSPDHDPIAHQQALDWFTRLRAENLGSEAHAAFETWRLLPQNARAYAEVEQLWQTLELPAHRVRKADRAKARRWPRYAAAACLLLAAGAVWLSVPALQGLGSDYATVAGERREVLLNDGSRLWLDSASEVDVDVQGATRTVRLRQGRLFADVVHDGRPFVVHVDEAKVEVLGTRFSVSRAAAGDEVVLLSGRVQVSTPAQQQLLAPGQRLEVQGERVSAPETVDAERLLAWRTGQLRVREVPLQQVLQQLAGYQGKRLVLLNAQAGQRRVSGSFNLDQADSALDALISSQQLQAHALLGHWLIIR